MHRKQEVIWTSIYVTSTLKNPTLSHSNVSCVIITFPPKRRASIPTCGMSMINLNRTSAPSVNMLRPKKDNVDKHIAAVHNNIKRYKCAQCDYVSSRKDCVDQH